jgi:anti-sigma-K factor RskA
MNPQLEDLASLYVLGRLSAGERTAFEARLSSDSSLAALVRKIEAALDVRRSLLALRQPLPDPSP